jgi:hypothetical protein
VNAITIFGLDNCSKITLEITYVDGRTEKKFFSDMHEVNLFVKMVKEQWEYFQC